MVVDDENQILLLVRAALEKAGFFVATVNDPRSAAETVLREKPDLVLCDLMMPQLDGYGVVAAIQQQPKTAGVPIAFLTAAPIRDNLVRAFGSGVVGYFEKPFHPSKLPTQIRRLLADVQQRSGQLFGMLRHSPLGSVIQVIAKQKRSGILRVVTPKAEGRAVFVSGVAVEASFMLQNAASLPTGDEALAQMEAQIDGEFVFVALDGTSADVVSLSAQPPPLPSVKAGSLGAGPAQALGGGPDHFLGGGPAQFLGGGPAQFLGGGAPSLPKKFSPEGGAVALPEVTAVEENVVFEATPEPPRQERILVVDDDPGLLQLLSAHFRKVGFVVSTAADGLMGLELAQRERPDVVLSDLAMPKVDGWQLFHRIRNEPKLSETRFIFLSGQAGFEHKLKNLGVDAEGYLEKGVLVAQIVRRIDQILQPRREVVAYLSGPGQRPEAPPLSGRIAAVGMRWLLRCIYLRRADVSITAENLWHRFSLVVREGQLYTCVDAGLVSSHGARKAADADLFSLVAFTDLCGMQNGEFSLTPEGQGVSLPLGDLGQLVGAAEDALEATERQVIDTQLISAPSLRTNSVLLDFYAAAVSPELKAVLEAVRQGESPKQIIAQSELSPLEIEEVLKDLVRKRVIEF